MLSTAARAFARCWPALLAWFLAGWTVRLLVLRLAADIGNDAPLVGQLILPIAVIARLASYVAMFLVLLDALPHVEDADPPRADGTRPRFLSRWARAIAAAILPFFVIYAAWDMVAEDSRDYASASLDQADLFAGDAADALDVSVDVWSLGVVILAFAGRVLLTRFAKRLPRWTTVVSAYLEAVWVLVALLVVKELLSWVPGWIATRRMFAPIVDGVDSLRDRFTWFRGLGDGFAWLLDAIGDLLFQPLAWVALAAVVYASARVRDTASRAVVAPRVERVRATVTRNWARLPGWARTALSNLTGGFQERWLPIASSVRLIWGAGAVTLGTFLLAYAVLGAIGDWIGILIFRALGPHPFPFWAAVDEPVGLLQVALIVPLQITLVAAAYDAALARSGELSAVRAAEREEAPNR